MSFSPIASLLEFFDSLPVAQAAKLNTLPYAFASLTPPCTHFLLAAFTPYVHVIVSVIDRNKTNGLQTNIADLHHYNTTFLSKSFLL